MKKKSRRIVFLLLILCVMTLCCSMISSQNAEAKTKKVSITKKITVQVGKKKKIKLKNNKKKVKWIIKNKKIVKTVKTSKQYAIIKGCKPGKTKAVAEVGKKKYICNVTVEKKNSKNDTEKDNGKDKDTAAEVVSDGQYCYSVEPLLPPFNYMFYVKTDNPNPQNIRFVDKNSIYYTSTEDVSYIVPCTKRFYDVEYENKETGRVKGGYIFIREGRKMDGGNLTMQISTDRYNREYKDTKVVLHCASVKAEEQYLVDEYVKSNMNFFEKLDCIQENLDKIALYPRSLLDSSKKSVGTPYPFLATSPYPELSLNAHYEIYEYSDESLLTKYLYPFEIDSLGFSSMMYAVASFLYR